MSKKEKKKKNAQLLIVVTDGDQGLGSGRAVDLVDEVVAFLLEDATLQR
jgi:hypothetical protein